MDPLSTWTAFDFVTAFLVLFVIVGSIVLMALVEHEQARIDRESESAQAPLVWQGDYA